MSTGILRTGLCILAASNVASAVAPLEAQEPVLLKRKADSIAALYREVDGEWIALRRADSLRMLSQLPVEPDQRLMIVRGLSLVADTSLATMTQLAAESALQQIVVLYGSGPVAGAVAHEQWYVNLDTVSEGSKHRKKRELVFSYRVFGQRGDGMVEGGRATARGISDLITILRRRTDDVMLQSMDSLATRWTARTLGAGENSNLLYESVFRELAIGQNENALGCYRRNLAACTAALGMELSDSLFRYSNWLSSSARASLLRLAVDSGGTQAFARFMADTNRSIARRLERAAGMPIDSLVVRWLSRAYNSRPQPAGTSPQTALMALLWGSLLCAISLRSSRWR